MKVTINKTGIVGTEKTVRVYAQPASPPSETPGGPNTPEIPVDTAPAIAYYHRGDKFDENTRTGEETANETWVLNVAEQSTAYFAVYKIPGLDITVNGADSAKVTQANTGVTVDGLTAKDDLAVFTVKTGDLVFDGGTRTFTLNVNNEGDALPKTVTVTLNVQPNETGAAVFKLIENDGDAEYLERVGGNFNSLVSAFTWVEDNVEADTEYTHPGGTERDRPALPCGEPAQCGERKPQTEGNPTGPLDAETHRNQG